MDFDNNDQIDSQATNRDDGVDEVVEMTKKRVSMRTGVKFRSIFHNAHLPVTTAIMATVIGLMLFNVGAMMSGSSLDNEKELEVFVEAVVSDEVVGLATFELPDGMVRQMGMTRDRILYRDVEYSLNSDGTLGFTRVADYIDYDLSEWFSLGDGDFKGVGAFPMPDNVTRQMVIRGDKFYYRDVRYVTRTDGTLDFSNAGAPFQDGWVGTELNSWFKDIDGNPLGSGEFKGVTAFSMPEGVTRQIVIRGDSMYYRDVKYWIKTDGTLGFSNAGEPFYDNWREVPLNNWFKDIDGNSIGDGDFKGLAVFSMLNGVTRQIVIRGDSMYYRDVKYWIKTDGTLGFSNAGEPYQDNWIGVNLIDWLSSVYSCQGTIPDAAIAIMCPNDDEGLSGNIDITIVSECSNNKCEYLKNEKYCDLPEGIDMSGKYYYCKKYEKYDTDRTCEWMANMDKYGDECDEGNGNCQDGACVPKEELWSTLDKLPVCGYIKDQGGNPVENVGVNVQIYERELGDDSTTIIYYTDENGFFTSDLFYQGSDFNISQWAMVFPTGYGEGYGTTEDSFSWNVLAPPDDNPRGGDTPLGNNSYYGQILGSGISCAEENPITGEDCRCNFEIELLSAVSEPITPGGCEGDDTKCEAREYCGDSGVCEELNCLTVLPPECKKMADHSCDFVEDLDQDRNVCDLDGGGTGVCFVGNCTDLGDNPIKNCTIDENCSVNYKCNESGICELLECLMDAPVCEKTEDHSCNFVADEEQNGDDCQDEYVADGTCSSGICEPKGDLNNDGVLDMLDLTLFIKNYFKGFSDLDNDGIQDGNEVSLDINGVDGVNLSDYQLLLTYLQL